MFDCFDVHLFFFCSFQTSTDLKESINQFIDGCVTNKDTSDTYYRQFCTDFLTKEFPGNYTEMEFDIGLNYCMSQCKFMHEISVLFE